MVTWKKSDIIGWTIFGIIAAAFIIGVTFWGQAMKSNDERLHWEQGYCAGIGGEWIADGICSVDGKVHDITDEL